MIGELHTALEAYHAHWRELAVSRKDQEFFKCLKPVAVGWKVADEAEYHKRYEELRDSCDKIIETWLNGRWIAKMHLKGKSLPGGIEIIKLMQRRPGSDDELGLDHVDFYGPAVASAETVLDKEPGLKWTHESNDAVDNYRWISVWFDGTEAKLKTDTVLDTVIGELQTINRHIVG